MYVPLVFAWCPYREWRAQIVHSLKEGRGVVLILIRYKIELGQKKALFSQSESHLVVRAYRRKFPSFLMEFLE